MIVVVVHRRLGRDHTTVGEWPDRRFRRHIIDPNPGAGLGRIRQVIGAFVFVHPGGFEGRRRADFDGFALHADHVFVEADDTYVVIAVAAEVEIGLTVVVDEYGRIE